MRTSKTKTLEDREPTVIVNGVKTHYRSLLKADSVYRKLLNANIDDSSYEIALIYNNYIYQANFPIQGYLY